MNSHETDALEHGLGLELSRADEVQEVPRVRKQWQTSLLYLVYVV